MQPWLKLAAETSVTGVRLWNLQTVCHETNCGGIAISYVTQKVVSLVVHNCLQFARFRNTRIALAGARLFIVPEP